MVLLSGGLVTVDPSVRRLRVRLQDGGGMVDMLIRRLRQAQVLVAFGCGVWLIVF